MSGLAYAQRHVRTKVNRHVRLAVADADAVAAARVLSLGICAHACAKGKCAAQLNMSSIKNELN